VVGRIRRCALALATLTIVLVGCGDDASSGSDQPTVEIIDNAFRPSTVRVKAGATVTWNWGGHNTHSVVGTFDGVDYNSGDHTSAERFHASYQFKTAGTYEYVCGFHGGSMKGTVIVA
jgi:plastocyanin